MRLAFLIMVGISLTACREQEASEVRAKEAGTRVRVASPAAARPKPLPPPLLQTPRITIFSGGSGMGYLAVQNREQADAMLADIRTLPPSSGRDRAISSVIGSLAGVDAAYARTVLENWQDGLIEHWIAAARSVAMDFGRTDPEAGADFILECVPRPSQVDVWSHFLSVLTPEQRVPFFESIPESSSRLQIAGSLVRVWVGEDPAACAAWLDEFAAGTSAEERRMYLCRPVFIDHRVKVDPVSWLAAFRAASRPEARAVLADGVWNNTEDSMKAEILPELEEAIPGLVGQEKERIIAEDPAGYAAALSEAQIRELSEKDVRSILNSWGGSHPKEAVQWAIDHDRPEGGDSLARLFYFDPKAAVDLAPHLPAGKTRDYAILNLTDQVAKELGQDVAKGLLPLISDEALRERKRQEMEGGVK
jgi:hypothetical protein